MDKLTLRKLHNADKDGFVEYLNDLVSISGALKGVAYEDGLSFEQLLEFYDKKEKIEVISKLQKEFPFYQYVLVREKDNKIVGAVNIRPYLTEELDKNYEGNIGYSISPRERGKGYAHIALKLAVEKYKKLNKKDNILICCYKENVPSKKVIEKAGGYLIDEKAGILTPQKYIINR